MTDREPRFEILCARGDSWDSVRLSRGGANQAGRLWANEGRLRRAVKVSQPSVRPRSFRCALVEPWLEARARDVRQDRWARFSYRDWGAEALVGRYAGGRKLECSRRSRCEGMPGTARPLDQESPARDGPGLPSRFTAPAPRGPLTWGTVAVGGVWGRGTRHRP